MSLKHDLGIQDVIQHTMSLKHDKAYKMSYSIQCPLSMIRHTRCYTAYNIPFINRYLRHIIYHKYHKEYKMT